jgi:hypothetical protein
LLRDVKFLSFCGFLQDCSRICAVARDARP